jgi:hypothetical protein
MGLGIVWSLIGFFSSRVEQAEYSVIKTLPLYELRSYPAHIVAQTSVKGSYDEALQTGFRIVAGYIFGGNVSKKVLL